MSELHPLFEAVEVVRRRTLANAFLLRLKNCWSWILAGVLLAAIFLPVSGVLLTGIILVVLAAALSGVRTWLSRPSSYQSACRLDSAASLHDRISTALHFARQEAPDALQLRQRRDALERLGQVDAKGLFPIRVPAPAATTMLLAVAVIGFLAYRMNYRPPVAVLSGGAAQTRLEQALQPLRSIAVEREFLKKLARIEQTGTELLNEILSTADLPKLLEPKQQPKNAKAGELAEGMPEEGKTADEQPGEPNQEGDNKGDDQPGEQKSQSLAQRMKRALNELLSKVNEPPKDIKDPSKEEQGQPQDAPEGEKASNAPPNKMPDAPGEAKAESGESAGAPPEGSSKAPGSGTDPNGNKPDDQQAEKSPPVTTKPNPEIVQLPYTDFKGEARVLTSGEAGEALLPLRDASARPVATTNGAEQESVPLRYRVYVQRYFDHPDQKRR